MRRRTFVAALGSAATWPLVARAQQSPVVGFLSAGTPEAYTELMISLRHGLQAVGYVEGQNVVLETRYAAGDFSSISQLASELSRLGVSIIVTTGTTSALRAKAGAPTVPLVFLTQVDPVIEGLVASLSRPGGNATGI
jgi:putative ABC transport system substrate-binding protein